MCITFFYLPADPATDSLFIAFNRDESVLRLTDDLHFWPSDPNVLAGTDTVLGGTWFGLNTKTQNIAFLTNLEDPLLPHSLFQFNMRSRGALIKLFLASDFADHHCLEQYLDETLAHAAEYNPFNAVFGNYGQGRYFYLNIVKGARVELPKNRVLGFSNNLAFEHSWEKVEHGLALLAPLAGDLTPAQLAPLLAVMHDRTQFDTSFLRAESSIYVEPFFVPEELKVLGTVSTSFLFVRAGVGEFHEFRTHYPSLERVKAFILKRKASVRLKNYFRLILFLARLPDYPGLPVHSVVPFTFK